MLIYIQFQPTLYSLHYLFKVSFVDFFSFWAEQCSKPDQLCGLTYGLKIGIVCVSFNNSKIGFEVVFTDLDF